jgi:hypothetical protein
MKIMAALAVAMLAACGAEPAAVTPAPPVTLAPLVTTLATHSLGVNSLTEMRLLATPHGRDVMSRIVSCALPRGESLTAITSDGTPYTFAGGAGHPPGWMQRKPTADEHRRVTACLQAQSPLRRA